MFYSKNSQQHYRIHYGVDLKEILVSSSIAFGVSPGFKGRSRTPKPTCTTRNCQVSWLAHVSSWPFYIYILYIYVILKHGGPTSTFSSCWLSWLHASSPLISAHAILPAAPAWNHVTAKFWSTVTTNIVRIRRKLGAVILQEISKENLRRWERKPVFFHIC